MSSLSICIPTFNRCEMLAELLDSIVAQQRPFVEVVVSDDASADGTLAVCQRYIPLLPALKIVRQLENVGHEQNFLDVVANASGDYVWLMGDDDRLQPKAIDHVLDALTKWPGIGGLTVGVMDYDAKFRGAIGVRRMPRSQQLMGLAATFGELADLLGYMSALVIDRAAWAAVVREDPIDNFCDGYLHVYITGRVTERRGSWGVLDRICVGYRADNDQFLSALGWTKRLKLDVIAYHRLALGLFPDNHAARRKMRARIFNVHVIARLRNAMMGPLAPAASSGIAAFLFRYYKAVPGFWYQGLPTLLAPRPILLLARKAYKRFSPFSGAARARAVAGRPLVVHQAGTLDE